MHQNPLLKLLNVSKKIGKHQILSNIDLEIGEGEIVGLLGPNGSGKTTLIRTIVGLVKANTGKIIIGDRDLYKHFNEAIRHVGAIVENPEFYGYLTGYQNLKQYAAMYKEITDERIDEVIALVNLEHAIHDKVRTYSLGMRQRLGIAQAILHRPKLLILDEPTNGLDPMGIREFRTYVKALCEKENVSIIIASHLLREIEDVCHRVAIIHSGEIIQVTELHNQLDTAHKVRFEIPERKKALMLIEGQGISGELLPDGVALSLKKEQIPEVICLLVRNEIPIFAVNSLHPSLEEAFFNVIGETYYD
ncbi:ABC transporter ATP-binding protein [Alkalihalobacillus sp. AL-G]|uniref:ABC transporter ATP-binding protein n=1 Tax=Alkalihalobacillus sp. AL-G TaxID=2926399 RepID=UPI00272B6F4C|nr:ABC transporter ATP-binding protein [Alkalihalobacillus sp. AL-G]WLD91608.1 ABC transporter ATP-binding protein [Alkalihalobacillus sp. AL-G]